MGRFIGIDFGTTNTVVAICDGSQTRVLDNREGRPETPSVVGLRRRKGGGEEILVGDMALANLPMAPEDTISSIKRLMGRGLADPEVQKVRTNYLYEVVEPADGTKDSVCVVMGGKQYSPVQISAMILKKVKEDAEFCLGEDVTDAVITVPAYFNQAQRAATRLAGEQAGLRVIKILDEPTAAAIGYRLDYEESTEPKCILVYDLGGETFDVSLLMGADNIFRTLATEGDMWLGGDDFDQFLVDRVLMHIQNEYGIEARKNLRFMATLRREARQAKERLSFARSTEIIIPGGLPDESGNLIDVEMEITREHFEYLIRPLVDKTIMLAEKAISGYGIHYIDHVLMTGNSTIVPLVQQAMEKNFGADKIMRTAHAKRVVAMGAARVAAVLYGKIVCQSPDRSDPSRECGHVNKQDAVNCEKCGAILNMAFDDMRGHDFAKASARVEEPEQRLKERERPEPLREKAEALMGFAQFVLNRYGWAFDLTEQYKLSELIRQTHNALERDDQTALKEKVRELDKATDDLPQSAQLLSNTFMVIQHTVRPADPVAAVSLLDELDRVESAVRNDDPWAADMFHRLHDKLRVAVESVGRDTGSPFVPGDTVDVVQFSVTSAVMVPGASNIVSVWAHLGTQREQVVVMAREESGSAEIRITSEGPAEISRGTVLTVRMSVQDLNVDPPEKTILWRGEIGKAGFAVSVPKKVTLGPKRGTAVILISGVPIMKIFFIVEVASKARNAQPVAVKERRYNRAFASYASQDRDAVLARIQGMLKAAPNLDVFLDVAKLRSGEHWQDRLREEIVTRDVMYLFWSEAASHSKWVEWEWRCGFRERGIEFIDPCPLAPPTKVPPPGELADKLHFNDWVLAYMSGEAAGRRHL